MIEDRNVLVSVAMATYNGEKYLKEQLESILNQTYKNIEIIVCDDCSSDNTLEILEEYSKKHALVYSVNATNLGFSKNFEKALSLCKGKYIALSDQDDIWLEEKLEILVNEIGAYSLICSDQKLIDAKGELLAPSARKKARRIMYRTKQFRRLVFNNFVTGCSVMFKKDLLRAALPFPEGVYHDWWLALVAGRSDGIKYVDIPLVLYRQHGLNHSGANQWSIKMVNNSYLQYTKTLLDLSQVLLKQKNIKLTKEEKHLLQNAIINYRNILDKRLGIEALIFLIRNFGMKFIYKLLFPISEKIKVLQT